MGMGMGGVLGAVCLDKLFGGTHVATPTAGRRPNRKKTKRKGMAERGKGKEKPGGRGQLN